MEVGQTQGETPTTDNTSDDDEPLDPNEGTKAPPLGPTGGGYCPGPVDETGDIDIVNITDVIQVHDNRREEEKSWDEMSMQEKYQYLAELLNELIKKFLMLCLNGGISEEQILAMIEALEELKEENPEYAEDIQAVINALEKCLTEGGAMYIVAMMSDWSAWESMANGLAESQNSAEGDMRHDVIEKMIESLYGVEVDSITWSDDYGCWVVETDGGTYLVGKDGEGGLWAETIGHEDRKTWSKSKIDSVLEDLGYDPDDEPFETVASREDDIRGDQLRDANLPSDFDMDPTLAGLIEDIFNDIMGGETLWSFDEDGFLTINEDKLAELTAEIINKFMQIIMVISILQAVKDLYWDTFIYILDPSMQKPTDDLAKVAQDAYDMIMTMFQTMVGDMLDYVMDYNDGLLRSKIDAEKEDVEKPEWWGQTFSNADEEYQKDLAAIEKKYRQEWEEKSKQMMDGVAGVISDYLGIAIDTNLEGADAIKALIELLTSGAIYEDRSQGDGEYDPDYIGLDEDMLVSAMNKLNGLLFAQAVVMMLRASAREQFSKNIRYLEDMPRKRDTASKAMELMQTASGALMQQMSRYLQYADSYAKAFNQSEQADLEYTKAKMKADWAILSNIVGYLLLGLPSSLFESISNYLVEDYFNKNVKDEFQAGGLELDTNELQLDPEDSQDSMAKLMAIMETYLGQLDDADAFMTTPDEDGGYVEIDGKALAEVMLKYESLLSAMIMITQIMIQYSQSTQRAIEMVFGVPPAGPNTSNFVTEAMTNSTNVMRMKLNYMVSSIIDQVMTINREVQQDEMLEYAAQNIVNAAISTVCLIGTIVGAVLAIVGAVLTAIGITAPIGVALLVIGLALMAVSIAGAAIQYYFATQAEQKYDELSSQADEDLVKVAKDESKAEEEASGHESNRVARAYEQMYNEMLSIINDLTFSSATSSTSSGNVSNTYSLNTGAMIEAGKKLANLMMAQAMLISVADLYLQMYRMCFEINLNIPPDSTNSSQVLTAIMKGQFQMVNSLLQTRVQQIQQRTDSGNRYEQAKERVHDALVNLIVTIAISVVRVILMCIPVIGQVAGALIDLALQAGQMVASLLIIEPFSYMDKQIAELKRIEKEALEAIDRAFEGETDPFMLMVKEMLKQMSYKMVTATVNGNVGFNRANSAIVSQQIDRAFDAQMLVVEVYQKALQMLQSSIMAMFNINVPQSSGAYVQLALNALRQFASSTVQNMEQMSEQYVTQYNQIQDSIKQFWTQVVTGSISMAWSAIGSFTNISPTVSTFASTLSSSLGEAVTHLLMNEIMENKAASQHSTNSITVNAVSGGSSGTLGNMANSQQIKAGNASYSYMIDQTLYQESQYWSQFITQLLNSLINDVFTVAKSNYDNKMTTVKLEKVASQIAELDRAAAAKPGSTDPKVRKQLMKLQLQLAQKLDGTLNDAISKNARKAVRESTVAKRAGTDSVKPMNDFRAKPVAKMKKGQEAVYKIAAEAILNDYAGKQLARPEKRASAGKPVHMSSDRMAALVTARSITSDSSGVFSIVDVELDQVKASIFAMVANVSAFAPCKTISEIAAKAATIAADPDDPMSSTAATIVDQCAKAQNIQTLLSKIAATSQQATTVSKEITSIATSPTASPATKATVAQLTQTQSSLSSQVATDTVALARLVFGDSETTAALASIENSENVNAIANPSQKAAAQLISSVQQSVETETIATATATISSATTATVPTVEQVNAKVGSLAEINDEIQALSASPSPDPAVKAKITQLTPQSAQISAEITSDLVALAKATIGEPAVAVAVSAEPTDAVSSVATVTPKTNATVSTVAAAVPTEQAVITPVAVTSEKSAAVVATGTPVTVTATSSVASVPTATEVDAKISALVAIDQEIQAVSAATPTPDQAKAVTATITQLTAQRSQLSQEIVTDMVTISRATFGDTATVSALSDLDTSLDPAVKAVDPQQHEAAKFIQNIMQQIVQPTATVAASADQDVSTTASSTASIKMTPSVTTPTISMQQLSESAMQAISSAPNSDAEVVQMLEAMMSDPDNLAKSAEITAMIPPNQLARIEHYLQVNMTQDTRQQGCTANLLSMIQEIQTMKQAGMSTDQIADKFKSIPDPLKKAVKASENMTTEAHKGLTALQAAVSKALPTIKTGTADFFSKVTPKLPQEAQSSMAKIKASMDTIQQAAETFSSQPTEEHADALRIAAETAQKTIAQCRSSLVTMSTDTAVALSPQLDALETIAVRVELSALIAVAKDPSAQIPTTALSSLAERVSESSVLQDTVAKELTVLSSDSETQPVIARMIASDRPAFMRLMLNIKPESAAEILSNLTSAEVSGEIDLAKEATTLLQDMFTATNQPINPNDPKSRFSQAERKNLAAIVEKMITDKDAFSTHEKARSLVSLMSANNVVTKEVLTLLKPRQLHKLMDKAGTEETAKLLSSLITTDNMDPAVADPILRAMNQLFNSNDIKEIIEHMANPKGENGQPTNDPAAPKNTAVMIALLAQSGQKLLAHDAVAAVRHLSSEKAEQVQQSAPDWAVPTLTQLVYKKTDIDDGMSKATERKLLEITSMPNDTPQDFQRISDVMAKDPAEAWAMIVAMPNKAEFIVAVQALESKNEVPRGSTGALLSLVQEIQSMQGKGLSNQDIRDNAQKGIKCFEKSVEAAQKLVSSVSSGTAPKEIKQGWNTATSRLRTDAKSYLSAYRGSAETNSLVTALVQSIGTEEGGPDLSGAMDDYGKDPSPENAVKLRDALTNTRNKYDTLRQTLTSSDISDGARAENLAALDALDNVLLRYECALVISETKAGRQLTGAGSMVDRLLDSPAGLKILADQLETLAKNDPAGLTSLIRNVDQSGTRTKLFQLLPEKTSREVIVALMAGSGKETETVIALLGTVISDLPPRAGRPDKIGDILEQVIAKLDLSSPDQAGNLAKLLITSGRADCVVLNDMRLKRNRYEQFLNALSTDNLSALLQKSQESEIPVTAGLAAFLEGYEILKKKDPAKAQELLRNMNGKTLLALCQTQGGEDIQVLSSNDREQALGKMRLEIEKYPASDPAREMFAKILEGVETEDTVEEETSQPASVETAQSASFEPHANTERVNALCSLITDLTRQGKHNGNYNASYAELHSADPQLLGEVYNRFDQEYAKQA